MNIAIGYVVNKQLEEWVTGESICKVIGNENPHSFVWFAMESGRAFIDALAADDAIEYKCSIVPHTTFLYMFF